MRAFVRRTILLLFFMFLLTGSMGTFISKVPAAVEVVVDGGWRVASRIIISVMPLRCFEKIVKHGIKLLLGICSRHLDLYSVEGLVMNDMVLW